MFEKKCKHRAVSMDKSCPVVVLENGKMDGNTGRCLWISPAWWFYQGTAKD